MQRFAVVLFLLGIMTKAGAETEVFPVGREIAGGVLVQLRDKGMVPIDVRLNAEIGPGSFILQQGKDDCGVLTVRLRGGEAHVWRLLLTIPCARQVPYLSEDNLRKRIHNWYGDGWVAGDREQLNKYFDGVVQRSVCPRTGMVVEYHFHAGWPVWFSRMEIVRWPEEPTEVSSKQAERE